MRWGVLWLAVAACGRSGFDPLAHDDGGSQIDGAGGYDAPAPDAATGPFGEATLVEELSDLAADDDPSLTGDLLEIYFKSTRGGDNDIWRAVRDSVDDPWGDPAKVDELNSGSFDGTPEVSYDGLTITLSTARGGGAVNLYQSTRDTRDDPWDPPAPIDDLNSAEQEYAAVMDAAGQVVVFNRFIVATNNDLYQAVRDGAGWATPMALANLSTAAYEADSHLDGDGLELYFAGELPDADGRDIYRTQRSSLTDDFAVPERVVELSTPQADEDPWVSPDGRVLVFSSDRSGDQEIYWVER